VTTGPDFSTLGAFLTTEAKERDFAGVVRICSGDEVIFSNAYGPASRRWPVPVTEDMRFDVASVTKLFTSVAVLQQVAAGNLELDAPITSYVDLAGTTISERVTLRHLLTHTSGIADDADEEAGESYEDLWRERPNYSVTRTVDFLPQFAHKARRFEPGTGCRYCNCGYVLAGLVLETATGEAYRDSVRTRVFEPAGMTRSGFFDMRDSEPDVAEGWERAGEGRWRRNIYSYPPIGSPDGGAHCTAADLVRFLQAVREGALLPPDLTAAFLTPQVMHHTKDEHSVHYGFGLEFMVVDGRVRRYYKDGVNTGASAIIQHYPDADLDVAIVSTTEDGAWPGLREINKLVRAGPRS
jgi:CubicO group peptidase (beta-lactamase class C family)